MIKKFIILLIFSSLILLVGCDTKTIQYKNLTFEKSYVIEKEYPFSLFIFLDEEGKEKLFYDSQNSSLASVLENDVLYNIEASVKDTWSEPDYIMNITKSKGDN